MRYWIPFMVYLCLLLFAYHQRQIWQRYPNPLQRVTSGAFLIYLVAILWLCLTPAYFNFESAPKTLFYFHGVPFNVIPFQGVSTEFFLNIVMTFPLGVFLYLINPHLTLERAGLYGFLFSLFIESNQFVCDFLFHIGRLADIDDLITNTLGALIGFVFMIIIDHTIFHHLIRGFMLKHG